MLQGWARIAQALTADPVARLFLVYDVLNEPDAFDLLWEGGNGKPALMDAYLQAMDAIHAVNPGPRCKQKRPAPTPGPWHRPFIPGGNPG